MEIIEFLTHLIERYGYIIVTLTIMLESAGIPMPGETALVVAAAFAGTGHLNIAIVILCAAAGAIIGDGCGYWAGRKLGRPFIEKHGKWVRLTPARMEKLEKLFFKHGPMTVFFGRFFALLRAYAALFAGVWHMPYGKFTLYNALGGIVWAMCFGMVGYLFGQNLPLLEKIARTVGWALTIPMVLIVALAFLWRWAVRHQKELSARFSGMVEKSIIGRLGKRYSWHIHWLLRHWTAAQYTVLHIAVGLAIAALGTWAFTMTAHSAFSDARLGRWDEQIQVVFASWATPLATTIFRVITWFGSYGVAAVTIAGIVIFVLRRRWLYAASVAVVVGGGQLLVFILKVAYARQRPDEDAIVLIKGFGFSFPSGHTMESLIVYGLLAYILIVWIKRWGAAAGIVLATALLVLLIGFSRLYLGLNYFSDVLSGLVGGVVWLSACLIALELLRRGQVGDRRRMKRVKTRIMTAIPVAPGTVGKTTAARQDPPG